MRQGMFESGKGLFLLLQAPDEWLGAGEEGERLSYSGESANETAVVVGETKEALQLRFFGWGGPVLDRLDLRLFHRNSASRDDMTKILDFFSAKCTLARFAVETTIPEDGEDGSKVSDVILDIGAVH